MKKTIATSEDQEETFVSVVKDDHQFDYYKCLKYVLNHHYLSTNIMS